MEHKYTVSKNVIEKIKRGLEMESAAMDRDIETDYKTLLSSELQKVSEIQSTKPCPVC